MSGEWSGNRQGGGDAQLHQFLESIPHGIVKVDLSGTITFSNPAHAKMHGYAVGELVGKKIWGLLADEQEQARIRQYFDVLVAEQSESTPSIVRGRAQDGSCIFAEIDWTYLRDEKDRLIGFLVVVTDITQRTVAEQQLRAASERYRLLFEEAPVMYITTRDVDGFPLIEDCNQHLLRTLGYSREEIIGQPLVDLYTPESRQALLEEGGYMRALAGDFLSEERQLYTKDGRVVETLLRAVPETDATQEVIGTRAMYVDVTEQRKLQEQLNHATKMEALGRLAGGIAHDFNNLLTIISGFARLQISRTQEQDGVERLQEIQKAAARGAELTSQLLSFTRQQDLEHEVLDLNRVVDDVKRLLRRTLGDEIGLRLEMAPSVSAVSANRGQVEQVLINLAVNARDAMPGGGELVIETADRKITEDSSLSGADSSPGDYVMVAVSDTGLGMTEEILDRIFDPFFTTKAGSKGTGLGLAIVYGIVRRHRGYVEVRSLPAQGTRFEIYLPATDEELAPSPVEAEVDEVEPSVRGKVLLVEDQTEVRQLIIEVLEEEGFEIWAVGTAEEARELYEDVSGDIDLLLSDVRLPESSGRELADQLQASSPIRVLLISGHDPETSPEEGVQTSSYPFLRKPFDGPTLLRRIRQLFRE